MLVFVNRLPPDQDRPVSATLSLTWDQRLRSRASLRLDDGRTAALLLPRGTTLKDGDLLVGAQGQVVRVLASIEDLSRVACADALSLARACYHLGNRHVPLQIAPDYVLYQRDRLLDEMLRVQGLRPEPVRAPFEPEAGAYPVWHDARPKSINAQGGLAC